MKEKLLFGMKDYCRTMAIVIGLTVMFAAPFLLWDYISKL